jgi:hypothetical protein
MTSLYFASGMLVLYVLYMLIAGRVPSSRRRAGFSRADDPRRYWFTVGRMLVFAVITYLIGANWEAISALTGGS